MRYFRGISFSIVLACLLAQPEAASAVFSGTTRVASGLSSPMFVTYAPGDPSRLFIVERGSGTTSTNATAAIKILNLNTGAVNSTPFLSIPGVNINGEGGLLGMAFSPNYQTDKKFYVYYTAGPQTTTFTSYVKQYTVSSNPDVANSTATDVLSLVQPPATNHKGGWIGFSPNNADNMYIAFGDGGGQGDDDSGHTTGTGNGQDTNVLLGKILRINVNGDDFPSDTTKNYSIPAGNPFASSGGAKEVWAYGLRNPFRNSFDRATGDLWIGDVGQDAHEEIDFQAANKTTVSNYEWRLWEGFSRYGAAQNDPKPANAVDPVYDYAHGSGALQGNAVIGGYVYRGPDPSIQNTYFFADEVSSHFWSMNTSTHAVANIDSSLTPNAGSLSAPSSFGEDSVGNMYIVSYGTGAVFRLATAHIPGDYDYDGDVDNSDYNVWRMTEGLGSITAPADGSGNSVVDGADYVIWRKNFGKTLGSGSGSETTVPEAGAFLYLMQAASVWAIQSLFARRRPLTRMMRSLS